MRKANTTPAGTWSALPAPSLDELALSDTLVRIIREEIDSMGAIDFARFMELALYAPALGYYSGGRQQFGESGDFVTAPEISPLFARCIARPCSQVLRALPDGDVLEAGAGSGALAAELLAELEALDSLPARYVILELSLDLRERQAARIAQRVPHLVDRVHWLSGMPTRFRGVVVANELLDALPVTRFVVTSEGARRLGVAWEQEQFVWRPLDVMPSVTPRLAPLALPDGYTSEIGLQAEAWVMSMSAALSEGMMLLIDYGFPRAEFYHPERNQGTLMCHYRHRAHADPFHFVGLQDITAHVDFTAIAEAADASGLSVLGYTSQASFLLETGLAGFLNETDTSDTRARLALTAQVKKLTLPSEMGELFKLIALGRGVSEPVIGFTQHDRRHRL